MLNCPKCDPDKNVRLEEWTDSVEKYISNPALEELLLLFNHRIPKGDLRDRLFDLRSFMDTHWDYRKKAGSGERWTVSDQDPIVTDNRERIIECAWELGMIDCKAKGKCCNYISPLGGVRAANLDRMYEAKEIQSSQSVDVNIVALTAMRPVSELEIPYIESYVDDPIPGKTTEFDVVCGAAEKVFMLDRSSCTERGQYSPDDLNSCWKVRSYPGVSVLSAPSSSPSQRRANTFDTLEFFLREMEVSGGSVIHFTTSSIYINYQTASLMPIAIKHNLELIFSGSGQVGSGAHPVTTNYLQEIKGSIDALVRFFELY